LKYIFLKSLLTVSKQQKKSSKLILYFNLLKFFMWNLNRFNYMSINSQQDQQSSLCMTVKFYSLFHKMNRLIFTFNWLFLSTNSYVLQKMCMIIKEFNYSKRTHQFYTGLFFFKSYIQFLCHTNKDSTNQSKITRKHKFKTQSFTLQDCSRHPMQHPAEYL